MHGTGLTGVRHGAVSMATKCPLRTTNVLAWPKKKSRRQRSLDVNRPGELVLHPWKPADVAAGTPPTAPPPTATCAATVVSSTLTPVFPTRLDELRHGVSGLSAAADCRRGVLTDGGAGLSSGAREAGAEPCNRFHQERQRQHAMLSVPFPPDLLQHPKIAALRSLLAILFLLFRRSSCRGAQRQEVGKF